MGGGNPITVVLNNWGVATQKKQKKQAKNRKSRVGLGFLVFLGFFCFFVFCLVFLLTIFRCPNNFKNFKKYPDTFRLLYDKGETSNQHDNKKLNKVKCIKSNHYERI